MPVRWIAIGGIALAYGLLLVLLRGEPSVASDQGVFLSVAARILDGDHLYSEVVDNKDPLFFYTYAAALAVGGWRGPFLLDGLWLGLAALSMALLVRELPAPRAAVLASFVVYPLDADRRLVPRRNVDARRAGTRSARALVLAPTPVRCRGSRRSPS